MPTEEHGRLRGMRRIVLGGCGGIRGCVRQLQELARGGEVSSAVGVAEEAIVADAVKPLGSTCSRKRRMNCAAESVMDL